MARGRRASSNPKERKHIFLTEGAWTKLQELYGPQGVTPSTVISQLVDFHLRRIDEKANLAAGQLAEAEPEFEVEIE